MEQNASVIELVEAVKTSCSGLESRRTEQDIRTHLSFELDGSRLRSLGWEPSENLADGLGELTGRLQGFSSPSHLSDSFENTHLG
jgi:hypothetical protein